MTALDRMPAVEKTSLFGTAVHAVLREASVAPDRIAAELGDAGLSVVSLSPVMPSLEDVFLDVVDDLTAKEKETAA
jgi:hypothetical protein